MILSFRAILLKTKSPGYHPTPKQAYNNTKDTPGGSDKYNCSLTELFSIAFFQTLFYKDNLCKHYKP